MMKKSSLLSTGLIIGMACGAVPGYMALDQAHKIEKENKELKQQVAALQQERRTLEEEGIIPVKNTQNASTNTIQKVSKQAQPIPQKDNTR